MMPPGAPDQFQGTQPGTINVEAADINSSNSVATVDIGEK